MALSRLEEGGVKEKCSDGSVIWENNPKPYSIVPTGGKRTARDGDQIGKMKTVTKTKTKTKQNGEVKVQDKQDKKNNI